MSKVLQVTPQVAKDRLDEIIAKGRTDLYKPVQIAEVLSKLRGDPTLNAHDLNAYRNKSLGWRDAVTKELSGKKSTSSAQYQHHIWEDSAMPPRILAELDSQNKATGGMVERYIYARYVDVQNSVASVITALEGARPEDFQLAELLEVFDRNPRIKRSVDKAYEVVAHSLFECIVVGLKAQVKVSVPGSSAGLLEEFAELSKALLGLDGGQLERTQDAHVYRVGVTNSADKGLDMWANFGPAVQVKHISLDDSVAQGVADQIESDRIVIVCKKAHEAVITTVLRQTSYGRRVRGIVTEVDLIEWYERALRGRYSNLLAEKLLERLADGFKAEFPIPESITAFMQRRGYDVMKPNDFWRTDTDKMLI